MKGDVASRSSPAPGPGEWRFGVIGPGARDGRGRSTRPVAHLFRESLAVCNWRIIAGDVAPSNGRRCKRCLRAVLRRPGGLGHG